MLRLTLIVRRYEIRTIVLEDNIRTFLLLLASLAASLIFGSVVAFVAVETLPCHWFGTGFEGACAHGVVWASLGIGLGAAVLSFAYLCYRVRRRRVSQTRHPEVSS